MQQFVSKHWVNIVSFLLVLLVFNVPFYKYPIIPHSGDSMQSLDPSWQIMLNHALLHKYVWGKDIVYTYGPLGFLETRVSYGIPSYVFILFDLFVIVNLFIVFKSYINNASQKWLAVFLLFCLCIVYTMSGSTPWLLMFFIVYWMRRLYDHPNILNYVILVCCISLALFMKLNTGLISIFLFGALQVLMLLQKKIKLLNAGLYVGASAIIILLLAWLLNVSLYGYFIAAAEIVKGYVGVMSIESDKYKVVEMKINILAVVLMMLYGWIVINAVRHKKYEHIFFAGVACIFIVLLRKQAISRNDWGHYLEFFSSSSLILFTGVFTVDAGLQKWLLRFTGMYILLLMLFDARMRTPLVLAKSKIEPKLSYISGIAQYNNKPEEKNSRKIPLNVLLQLKGHTVDVFPWDAACAIENKLTYTPRPMFQSIGAFTEKLQLVNENHLYTKPSDYLLYEYATIDGRYAFFDDCRANIFIANNYKVADSFLMGDRQVLLLKRNGTNPVATKFDTIKTESYAISDKVFIQGSDFIKIKISENNKGRLNTFLNRAQEIKLVMTLDDGSAKTYKTSAEMLQAGMFVAAFIDGNTSFTAYINKGIKRKITSLSLSCHTDYFVKNIEVIRYNISK
ncbi:hypothetical protein CAP35_11985 [Chitinophagaceae bacterium IBVUCB1]|nr:hypothetical protein CAP35_11985 [Chitinophagaceae bacterium IBVUCB1]